MTRNRHLMVFGTLFAALALNGCGLAEADAEADAAELAAGRQVIRDRLAVTGPVTNKTLLCAARRVSDATAEASLLAFINERGDLNTPQQREAASRETVSAIEACGGNIQALAADLASHGDDVPYLFAVAVLQVGRDKLARPSDAAE